MALLDAQPLPELQRTSHSGSSPSTPGDCHEPQRAHAASTANPVTARQRRTVGATASRRARSLSPTRRPTADGSNKKLGRRR
jgi:hypothetical protein